jgi:hypothetical protein
MKTEQQPIDQMALARARDAFLASGKSLTIHSRDGARKGAIVGNLDERLAAALKAAITAH